MTTKRRRTLTISVIVVLAVAGLVGLRVTSGGAAGTESATLEFGGRMRTCLIHLPHGYDGKTPVPLVLVLHGGTQGPESVEGMSGMSAKADKEHFIAVYPSGTGRLSWVPTWNAGNCCGYAMINHVDDVGFLGALIDKLEKDYPVDPKRVFVTGISNGAMMSYRVGCELADKVAAIAPVEGAQNVACEPSSPVAVMIFHGTADRLVPMSGGTTPFQVGPRRTDTSVAAAVAFWVKRDGCDPEPKHEETIQLHSDKYSGCKDGTTVEFYAIQGGHHAWPGTRFARNNVPATDLMWAFFAAHPKP